jgi:hypothetical protein
LENKEESDKSKTRLCKKSGGLINWLTNWKKVANEEGFETLKMNYYYTPKNENL